MCRDRGGEAPVYGYTVNVGAALCRDGPQRGPRGVCTLTETPPII